MAAQTPTPVGTQTPPELESLTYLYDGDGNMVNQVTTYFVGKHYDQVGEGENAIIRKYYFADSSTIAMRENEPFTGCWATTWALPASPPMRMGIYWAY